MEETEAGLEAGPDKVGKQDRLHSGRGWGWEWGSGGVGVCWEFVLGVLSASSPSLTHALCCVFGDI